MSKESNSSGIGIIGLLGVAFVVLKLTNYIDWSWWYVTLPFWGGLALLLLFLGTYFIYQLLKSKKGRVPKMENPPPSPVKKSKFRERLDKAMEEAKQNKSNL